MNTEYNLANILKNYEFELSITLLYATEIFWFEISWYLCFIRNYSFQTTSNKDIDRITENYILSLK